MTAVALGGPQRGHVVPLEAHGRLLDDTVRVEAFARAIAEVVRPGDVVLDVGTGTGILAMLAVKAGAARVHAVESQPVAEVARAVIEANGYGDRIIVHRADIVELEPVEPVDVVLGEFLGRFLVDDEMIDAVEAAMRWLKPGGRCLPSEIRLMVAPVGDFRYAAVDRFLHGLLDLDLSAALPTILADTHWGVLSEGHLLASPAVQARWRLPGPPPGWERTHWWEASRSGRLRALAGWFEADLSPTVTLTNGPGTVTHWGQLLMPLAPQAVVAGDSLVGSVRLEAQDDGHHVWWSIERPDSEAIPGEVPDLNASWAAFRSGEPIVAARGFIAALHGLQGAERARVGGALAECWLTLGDLQAAEGLADWLSAEGFEDQGLLKVRVAVKAQSGRPEAQALLDAYQRQFGLHPWVKAEP